MRPIEAEAAVWSDGCSVKTSSVCDKQDPARVLFLLIVLAGGSHSGCILAIRDRGRPRAPQALIGNRKRLKMCEINNKMVGEKVKNENRFY